MDYFTLFGLPPGFTLNAELLATRYQELQRQFHPDKYTSRPQAEQLLAVQQSATINQGWQTLRHPLPRAEYIPPSTVLIWLTSSIPCATPRF